MIVSIMIQDNPFFYDVIDEVGNNLYKLQLEFGRWLSKIEGNHPFKIYTEIIESNGEVSFAGYMNIYGPDDFIGWINVEKYCEKVAVKIKDCIDLTPVATIHF
ncbi:hypothetical protein NQ117_16655 [Paenibacillus sp. SC116]|uniref:hypothetical protein n=1 Tax=Paenibacillus sp. SC116 TaxID=2968986 RepID=UPI00215B2519|nr:hypothetical protein [Paenibacillus sp. SC116]MCR8845315.1 hypothetical protein [Paenibacillus sp. SC116]